MLVKQANELASAHRWAPGGTQTEVSFQAIGEVPVGHGPEMAIAQKSASSGAQTPSVGLNA
jgi:hypothetical protein